MIAGIHISPSDIIIRKETAKNAVFASLKQNQKTDAKVLKVFSDNKALVLIAGKKVIIKTPFFLTEGEKLLINIVKEGEEANFKVISSKENRLPGKIASLIRYISKANPFAGLSKTDNTELFEMLKSISLKSERPDKDFLPRLLDKSGILLEKKVLTLLNQEKGLPSKNEIMDFLKNDIKGYVLNKLFTSDKQNIGNIKFFSEYSAGIENFQTINAHSADSGKYLIPFPVFSNDFFSFGQLFLDLGDLKGKENNNKKEQVINISFLLNMSKIGDVRADFSIYKKAISGIFYLSSVEICDFVKIRLPQLKERLIKIEYLVNNIKCKVASKEDFSPASLIETFVRDKVRDENRILNIII